jgi:NitT/TauT family transport system ATP-binding protein
VVEDAGVVYEGPTGDLGALRDINLSIGRGEFVSVIGPSGSGKSTLLRVIAGLLRPTAGRVLIDGSPPREAQREKKLGFVFQDASLLPWRNVLDNVRLPLEVNRHAGEADADELIDLVGLREFRHYYPQQLSGGMQQRVAIARALITTPSLLLMDEPFGALDEITRGAMRLELLRIWRARGEASPTTVVFVTHSIPEALLLSDRVVVLSRQPGRITAVMDVDLPRPRAEGMEYAPEFAAMAHRLRALLREPSLV